MRRFRRERLQRRRRFLERPAAQENAGHRFVIHAVIPAPWIHVVDADVRRQAAERGLGFSIEAHVGSVCDNPTDVARLCELAPDLRLTLDYTHFVSQGIAEREIEPLASLARHVQTRGVAPDLLQAPLKRTELDFERMIDVLTAAG